MWVGKNLSGLNFVWKDLKYLLFWIIDVCDKIRLKVQSIRTSTIHDHKFSVRISYKSFEICISLKNYPCDKITFSQKTIKKVLIFSHYELVSHIKCNFLKFALFFQIFPYCGCRKEFHFFTVTCQPPLFSFFLGNLQGSQKIFETGVWSGLLGFGQYGNHGGFLHIERHTRRRSKYL